MWPGPFLDCARRADRVAARFLPKLLLLQVRHVSEALEHERRCIRRVSGGRADLTFRNLVDEPELRWADVHRFEVLMLGGSGESSATAEYPFTRALEDVVRRWAQEGRPFMGSCWGHHFLATALGGKVRTDPKTSEVGTFPVELAPAGRRDPLFSTLPPRFQAQMGHHDWVAELPQGAEALAHSERCANQAVKLVDKPIYTTQFHSELGRREILERLVMYKASYLEGASLEEMGQRIKPSPAVRPLLGRFLELYT